MAVISSRIRISSKGEGDIQDITRLVQKEVEKSKLTDGVVTVFVPGSTGAVTTLEYEPGLLKDIPRALKRIAPDSEDYAHHLTWGCDNGRSHVKASIIGPSLTVPFHKKSLILGTWQQIVFLELDTQPRSRALIVQIIGE